ncbi:hypothetical protein ACO3UB_08420 (plasmid) [Methanocaldococcus sp. 16A]
MNDAKLFILRFYFYIASFMAFLGLMASLYSAWDAGVICVEIALLTFVWMWVLYYLPDEYYT